MTGEKSWEDLAWEFEQVRSNEAPLWAQWFAHYGSETHGIWLLRPQGPSTEEPRVKFSLLAARGIEKLGIPPLPIPGPSQFFRYWNLYRKLEEKIGRVAGKKSALSNTVPHGLGEVDRDAVDPCSRAWLELLRRESHAFAGSLSGTLTIRGKQYRTWSGRIQDVCRASSVYCLRCAREAIRERLTKSANPCRSRSKGAISGPAGELADQRREAARKRGRPRNEERRTAIHDAIRNHGDDWRNYLSEIFEELNGREVPLGDFHALEIDVGDGQRTKAMTWKDLDLALGPQRNQIIDALRKYA